MNFILSDYSGSASKCWLCSSLLVPSILLGGCSHLNGVVDDCSDSLDRTTCQLLLVGSAAAMAAPLLGIASGLIDGEDSPKQAHCGYDDSLGIPWRPGSILDAEKLEAVLREPEYLDTVLNDPSIPFARLTDDVTTWADYAIDDSDGTFGQVSLRLPYTLKYENGMVKAVHNPNIHPTSRTWESKVVKTLPDAIESKVQGEVLEAVFSKPVINSLGTAAFVVDVGKVLLENRKANELKSMAVKEPARYRQLVRQDATNELYRGLAQQISLHGWGNMDAYFRAVYRRGTIIQMHNQKVLRDRGCVVNYDTMEQR